MKPTFLYSFLIGSFILGFASGCERSAPAPVVNPPGVETSLASTARAFAKQTEAANPFTATPSPTATLTLTPTPKISLNGMSLAVKEDKSTLFTDHRLGYQLTIPPGWMPIRINEDEFYKAFAQDFVLENPMISNFLTNLEKQDPDHFRLSLLDMQPEHTDAGLATAITVVLQADDGRTLDDWAKTKSARASTMAGYQFISSQFAETPSGERVLVREEKWDAVTIGKRFSRRVFFALPAGILTVDLETNFDSKETVIPEFEQIVNNLTFFNP